MTEKTQSVSWYTCDCPWTTKLCDYYHMQHAPVPVSVLEQYVKKHEQAD